jgi:UDP-N-acetylglucosamine acyltransferase
MTVHPSALVDAGASVANDAEIGPFCVLGPGVRVGPGCRLGPRVTIYGPVVLGRGNVLHPQVTIGKPDGGAIEIGDRNVFREFSNVDAAGGATTRIGSGNLLGTWVAVLSGSSMGNGIRVGAYSVIGENNVVEDDSWIEGLCVIDANRHVGRGSRIRSMAPVARDVPPYVCVDGHPLEEQSVNPRRRTPLLDAAFEIAFRSELAPAEAARKLRALRPPSAEVEELAAFLAAARPPEAADE